MISRSVGAPLVHGNKLLAIRDSGYQRNQVGHAAGYDLDAIARSGGSPAAVGCADGCPRPMTVADLPTVAGWLAEPHVARWWAPATTAEAQLDKYSERIRAGGATTMLMAGDQGRPVGSVVPLG